jgi:hypothetical protein
MVMKLALASVFLGLVVLAGCDKPSERDCRRAIGNIRKLMGTSQMTLADGQDAAWLRSCKRRRQEVVGEVRDGGQVHSIS